MDMILLKKAREGDSAAFEALVTPFEDRLWRICWHYTGTRQDAMDCAQETMLRAWRGLNGFRGESALETWLYRIAAGCCLDFLRKKSRDRGESLEPLMERGFNPADETPGTEETVIRREQREHLRAAIADLPEEQRDALILTQLEGMEYEAAASFLGVAPGTVRSRVNRAREKLKKIFRDAELFPDSDVKQNERSARA